jgi:hypothetical protein
MEKLGTLFKGDPTFEYIFNKLPKSYFMKIVELREKRMTETNMSLSDLL